LQVPEWQELAKDPDGLENKDGKDGDEDSENDDAGGVLRASGADADRSQHETKIGRQATAHPKAAPPTQHQNATRYAIIWTFRTT
jgi:hypothetical protein